MLMPIPRKLADHPSSAYNTLKGIYMHHTKEKGDLGVLKAQVDLHQQGWMVLSPHTEHAPFDIVGYRDSRFLRIQVKFRSEKNGVLAVHLKSIWSDKHGTHEKPMDKEQVDLLCVYCPETDECYYVRPLDFNKNVTLRVRPTKNNQSLGVLLASDYRKIP
jgi:hypothetical protein